MQLPNSMNIGFLEDLFADYVRDPAAVPAEWREYFDGLPAQERPRVLPARGPSFRPASIFNPGNGNGAAHAGDSGLLELEAKQDRVDQMVRAYRVRGHMFAQLDPLGLSRQSTGEHPELDPAYHGFTDADLDRPFSSRTIKGANVRTLREILEVLRETYCRFIGAQFMHIDELRIRNWLQERMEGSQNRIRLGLREQFRILTRLTDAVVFEEFIQKKFIGAKSFSLEGGEGLIPLLDLAIEQAGDHGIEEVVLGMAHRGRLNVLANIVGKSPREIFREFEDLDAERKLGRGDVKYHLGYHGDWVTASGRTLHVALCFNPSHLEFVNPVALGRQRAKQDRSGDHARERSMAILIHGDAAFAGEGIAQETLNLSELKGYSTGGTLHIIVNNQIGFTTTPGDARSTPYCTDVAKMLQSPIFHVNGENPEAVAQVVQLAMDFRREFKRDVFIDMYCFRRRGHNESDEPAFTQPVMYRAIRNRRPLRETYLEHLAEMDGVTREAGDALVDALRERLEAELAGIHSDVVPRLVPSTLGAIWAPYRGGLDPDTPEVDTGVDRAALSRMLEQTTHLPEGFRPHRTLARLLEKRRRMAAGEELLDWAAAEALAFGTLACEGARVRMTGQDSCRGTFSHRHAVLHDAETGDAYMPLAHLAPHQAPVEIFNSPLSEAGVLGFEYGYSIAYPDGLVLWEAQFGDFANAAQVIIDQFISSAEDKWHRLCSLVMLLPHGFEGQGPEHSSARIERFLELAADDNIQIVVPSTPAQYFHLLRRQVVRPWRKPLVVMTPKSLLREQASSLDELATGRFQRIIPDAQVTPGKVRRVLLCSGKVYFDLVSERSRRKADDVAIIRIEQIFPLAPDALSLALAPFSRDARLVWVQEEPNNMGAWRFLHYRFYDKLSGRALHGVTRPASASPATGSPGSHKLEQARLLEQAFTV